MFLVKFSQEGLEIDFPDPPRLQISKTYVDFSPQRSQRIDPFEQVPAKGLLRRFR